MTTQRLSEPGGSQSEPAQEIGELYRQLLDAWNRRDAHGFAALFAAGGSSVGFDGSQANGSAQVEAHLAAVFAEHVTAEYVAAVREVRMLAPGAGLLRAVSGLVPRGGNDVNPAANAIQTLVAVHGEEGWRIALLQNTPAQFHGRPEEAQRLTDELRALAARGRGVFDA